MPETDKASFESLLPGYQPEPEPDHPLLAELVAEFNGLIKYAPMLADHVRGKEDDWTRDECLVFARAWHAVAFDRLQQGIEPWNDGIPYCRNIVKDDMRAALGLQTDKAAP